MQSLFHKIRQNRFFFLFILLFAYIKTVYIRILVRGELNLYIFTPEAAFAKLIEVYVLFLIVMFFIRKWQQSEIYQTKEMVKIFGTSLLMYVLIMQTFGLGIAFVFGNIQRNFNWETGALSSFSYLLDGIIYGSFILLYYYYQKNSKHMKLLASYNQALSDSRINQLKMQMNPHFLFNNLNILDQLINEDRHKASEFLIEFADIYRYVLQASDKKLVTIGEELVFAEQYFKLIQYKYGPAYQLTIKHTADGCIVPLTLQLLIENAIQHNAGTAENPVHITITAADHICITNNVIPKWSSKQTSGRALKNSIEQYKLLSQKPIEIYKSDNHFSVFIPIIQPQ